MTRISRFLLSLAPLLLAAGCVASALDRHFAAGQYLEVARLFEADSSLQSREKALYFAAMAYALPESPAYDPSRAIETLDRLLTLYPRGSRSGEALRLRQILQETDRLARETQRLEENLAEATAARDSTAAMLAELHDSIATQSARADGLQAIADRLTREVRERDARIQALQAELDGLKQIDMGRPPPERPVE